MTAERKIVKTKTPVVRKTTVSKSSVAAAPVTDGYVLQLAASGNPTALKTLATSSGLQAKTQIYKNQSNGMYVLIYGEYNSSAAAKAAVAGLPVALRSTVETMAEVLCSDP